MNMELTPPSAESRHINAFSGSFGLGGRDKAPHAHSTLATISANVKDEIVLR